MSFLVALSPILAFESDLVMDSQPGDVLHVFVAYVYICIYIYLNIYIYIFIYIYNMVVFSRPNSSPSRIRPRPCAPKLQLVAPPPVVEVAAPVVRTSGADLGRDL